MKTIGLIGGMSWESTIPYYSTINSRINAALGGNHSAKCLLYSVDFQEIEELQYAGDWDALERKMLEAAKALKAAGAECIALCTNTMHKVAGSIEREAGLPLLHIVDAVGEAIRAEGKRRVGLLGTIFTMRGDFYRKRLEEAYGLEVLVPGLEDMEAVNAVIYGELVKGVIKDSSRERYLRIMDGMRARGAEGMILGCTEIGLLVKDYPLSLYDSAELHARMAADFCLGRR